MKNKKYRAAIRIIEEEITFNKNLYFEFHKFALGRKDDEEKNRYTKLSYKYEERYLVLSDLIERLHKDIDDHCDI